MIAVTRLAAAIYLAGLGATLSPTAFAQTAYVSTEALADQVRADALVLCAAEWPADFSMQAACLRWAEDGAADLRAIRRHYAGNLPMQRALQQCVARWTSDGRTDFSMAGFCARNQDQGYRELGR